MFKLLKGFVWGGYERGVWMIQYTQMQTISHVVHNK